MEDVVEPGRPQRASRRRVVLAVVAAVVFVVTAPLAVAGLLAPPAAEGAVEVRARAVEACANTGADPDACRCAVDRLADADLLSLDEGAGVPPTLPDAVVDAVGTCAVDLD